VNGTVSPVVEYAYTKYLFLSLPQKVPVHNFVLIVSGVTPASL
jgi:hypothetical protein